MADSNRPCASRPTGPSPSSPSTDPTSATPSTARRPPRWPTRSAASTATTTLSVAVLTGAGGTFCAGADLKAVATGQGNRVARRRRRGRSDGPVAHAPRQAGASRPSKATPSPAASSSRVWCDLRVAAEDAVFGVYCRRWGVPLIDGGTIRLPRLIGHSRAMDLILTGRGVSGDEAVAMGLVNRLAPRVALSRPPSRWPTSCPRCPRAACAATVGRRTSSGGHRWTRRLSRETELGLQVIRSGETQAGAARFAAGAGRHGQPA